MIFMKNKKILFTSILLFFIMNSLVRLSYCISDTYEDDEKDLYFSNNPKYEIPSDYASKLNATYSDKYNITDIDEIKTNISSSRVLFKVEYHSFNLSKVDSDNDYFSIVVYFNNSFYENSRIEFEKNEGNINSKIKYESGQKTLNFTTGNDFIFFNLSRVYYGDGFVIESLFSTINEEYEFETYIDIYPNYSEENSQEGFDIFSLSSLIIIITLIGIAVIFILRITYNNIKGV